MRRRSREFGYRLLDVACAVSGLVVLAPFLAAISILVLLRDGRPLLFRQVRVGRGGVPFVILKFRTMRNGVGGSSITARGDLRVTRVGAWLRKLKLDELPQLFNVLRGDMSLIGPRPELPGFVRRDDAAWQALLAARPGITDLASLVYRDEERLMGGAADPDAYYRARILPVKLALNLEYLKTRTLWSDLKLLALTVRYSFLPYGFESGRIRRGFVEESRS